MTRSSKTDWHQLNGITHWTQQRVDSHQGIFSTWYCRINLILYRVATWTYLHALTARSIPIMTELLHESEPSSERAPQNLKRPSATHCYVQRLNHLVMTRPSKTDWHQLDAITLNTTTSLILRRDNSLLNCLHLALAYRYHFYGGGMKSCLRALAVG